MWDTFRLSAIGKLIGSKIAVLLVAAFMSAFLVATTYNPTAFAADATWNGDNISYNNDTYTKQPLTLPGTDSSSQVYVSDKDKSKVIIVPGGADTTKDIENAQQATYTVDANGNYSNQTDVQKISVGPKQNSPDATNGAQSKTSCAVDGVGWIVCTMSRFLAGAMDKAYGWIAEFLVIKPLTTDTTSGLFQTWNIARGLANACFIIAFLLIIYAQITNYGISNYEIKKMIPKLIVAAIAVNVSYYICAIAVDVSNILGDSIAKALIQIRQGLPAPDSQVTWNNLVATILSGGTIIAIPYAVGAAGGLTALVPLLAPMLIGGILSILVAVMVLAARQALVVVLVVLAPLAFVAYLLPNTEKMFKKWREIFMNMLVIFPLFSLLFGGAQLASSIIIQSTDKISVVLLAMFVQVAPLMITPFLMKVGHGLLTQVGGFLNNPRKGLVDRSRGWANEYSQMARDRYRAQGANKSGIGRFRPQAVSYNLAKSKINRQNAMKVYQDQIAASVAQDKRAQELLADSKAAALKKGAGDALGERLFEERKATDSTLQHYSGKQRLAQMQTKTYQAAEDASWEEMLSRNMQEGNVFAANAQAARTAHEYHHIAEGRQAAAKAMQKVEHAEDLIKSENLQKAVGGIADHGAERALAAAVNEYRKDYNDRVNEAAAILKHYNLSGTERQKLALGEDVYVDDGHGSLKVFRKDSKFAREAAIEQQLGTGTYKEIEQIVQLSGSELKDFKTTISAAIAQNKLSSKAVFLGGKTIDDAGQGKITDFDKLMQAVTATIARGKISANDLATNENTALQRIFEAAHARNTAGLTDEERANLDASIQQLKAKAEEVLRNPNISRDLRENSRLVLEDIVRLP